MRSAYIPGLAAGLLIITLFVGAQAAELRPSDASPSSETTPVLTITAHGERQRLSLADIEAVGLYESRFRHFEGPEGRFLGVRLKSLLDAYDISGFQRIRLVAEDGYTVFLNPDELRQKTYLLVTRLDGEPIPRDAFGPLMLVVPEDAEAVMRGDPSMTRWIWGIVELQAL